VVQRSRGLAMDGTTLSGEAPRRAFRGGLIASHGSQATERPDKDVRAAPYGSTPKVPLPAVATAGGSPSASRAINA